MPTNAGELPRVLFVSPTYPDTQGNGLAMRAGMFIEALAQRYRVSLLVIPLFDYRSPSADAFIRRFCSDETVVQPQIEAGAWERLTTRSDHRPANLCLLARQAKACIAALGEARFDVIHAFRLYTAPLAVALAAKAPASQRPQLHLDIDDVESATRISLAELYRRNGLDAEAKSQALEADRYLAAERQLVPQFDRVYVCSEGDAAQIEPLARGTVAVVPNAIRPPETAPARLTSHPFTFLFIGNLDYYPNRDAIRYFCSEVLPRLRKEASVPLLVRIVGGRMPAELAALSHIEEVRLAGHVPDVSLEYAEADAAIVPIRAGGGTRIKVLEAFAHQRPVVSTSVGVEGIDGEPDRDFLLADTLEAFAAQCLRLMTDAELGRTLAQHAAVLLGKRYTQESVNSLIAGLA